MKHYIMAGRYNHAQMVARTHAWSHREYVFIHNDDVLRGVNFDAACDDIYVYAATYREHPHVHEVMREIDRLQFTRNVKVHWIEECELAVNRRPDPESCKLPFTVSVKDSGNEIANLRRAAHYIDDQLAYLGHQPAHDPWGVPQRAQLRPSYDTVELREVMIPANQVSGYRIAEREPGTVHIISVEPSNPSDRNAPWLVRFQERRR